MTDRSCVPLAVVVLHRREKTRCATNWTSKTSWPKLFLSVTRCACNLVGILHSTSISSQRTQPCRRTHSPWELRRTTPLQMRVLRWFSASTETATCRCMRSAAFLAHVRQPRGRLADKDGSGHKATPTPSTPSMESKARSLRRAFTCTCVRLFLHTSPQASCNTNAHPTEACWWCLGSTLSVR